MSQTLPWIITASVLALLLIGMLVRQWLQLRAAEPAPLPAEWALTARPVFSNDERRVYRLLREALPHHIVLSKLPLVRFCQPSDPTSVRYWYDLLGNHHVTFAICSANGRLLAAVDLDNERGNSRRVMQIKQSVLSACRVRYMRCPLDHLPSVAELQLLVPHSSASSRGPQPPAAVSPAPDKPQASSGRKVTERPALWQDSSAFQDSFFAPDPRFDTSSHAELPQPGPAHKGHHPTLKDERGSVSSSFNPGRDSIDPLG
jgi:hypothetical protein